MSHNRKNREISCFRHSKSCHSCSNNIYSSSQCSRELRGSGCKFNPDSGKKSELKIASDQNPEMGRILGPSSIPESSLNVVGQKKESSPENLCTVCMELNLEALIPCGHVAMCMTCASQLKECPICRSSYNPNLDVRKVFIVNS